MGGLRLDYHEKDFDCRPLDEGSLHRLFTILGSAFENWRDAQTIFLPVYAFDASAATEHFFGEWMKTPFREKQGGSRFNNLLWLYLIAKAYRPTLIVDSGTFEGGSAWSLALGAPGAKVLSFDLSLKNLRIKAKGVTYIDRDWSSFDISCLDHRRLLCYFDDHVDQARRLIEASDRGCDLAIFDDDYPVSSYYTMAPSPSVLPKIEFVLDLDLRDGQRLEWLSRGREMSYTVNRAYLDRARARIARTERLPNTSLITGIHQTPYRLIAVAPPVA
jgi:hypothetical protein